MTLEEANEIFGIIAVGNKMVVMERNPDGSIHEFWSFDEFRRKLVKESVRVKTKSGALKVMPFAQYWLTHPQGRSYRRLVYAVPGSSVVAGPDDFNGWMGFTVEPKAGSWARNKAHILNVLCNGNEEQYTWIINWMAALFQAPGIHARTAIVLQGGQGTGKGHFAHNLIGGCFGPQQYIHILGSNQLTAEFNEHLSGKCLVFADESTWGGDPRAASKLKGLITEDTVPIHRKYLKMVEEPSMLHTIISSNNEWPVPIEHDDRRFSVFKVSESQKQNDNYFAQLRAEIYNGGRAAMLYELMEYTIDERMLRQPIMTAAKSAIAVHSMKPIEHWWLEVLESGIITENTWPETIAKRTLHTLYLDFLEKHHRSNRDRRATETEMGMFLKRFSPITQQMMVNGTRERYLMLPSLEECRARWVAEFNWPADYQWDREDVIEYGHPKQPEF
jgi:hypothetical protein